MIKMNVKIVSEKIGKKNAKERSDWNAKENNIQPSGQGYLLKDIKSAKEFCNLNKIKPEMVIVVWNE